MSIEPLALPLSVIRPSTAGSNGTEPSTRSTGDRFAAVLADAGADAGATPETAPVARPVVAADRPPTLQPRTLAQAPTSDEATATTAAADSGSALGGPAPTSTGRWQPRAEVITPEGGVIPGNTHGPGAVTTGPLSQLMGPNGEVGYTEEEAPVEAHRWVMPDGQIAFYVPGKDIDPARSLELSQAFRDTYAIQDADGTWGVMTSHGFKAFPEPGYTGAYPGLTSGILESALRAVAGDRRWAMESYPFTDSEGVPNIRFSLTVVDGSGDPEQWKIKGAQLKEEVLDYLRARGIIAPEPEESTTV